MLSNSNYMIYRETQDYKDSEKISGCPGLKRRDEEVSTRDF